MARRLKDGSIAEVLAFKRLLTQAEAALYLSTSPQTLKAWPIKPRIRPDGVKRYDIRDLDAFSDGLPYDGEEDGCDGSTGWEDFA